MRAVVRDDRRSTLLQSFEDFRFRVGDRFLRTEILDVRGRDRGDQGEMWANLTGQRGDVPSASESNARNRSA